MGAPMISFRMTLQEYESLRDAAERNQETISEFVRQSVTRRLLLAASTVQPTRSVVVGPRMCFDTKLGRFVEDGWWR